MQIFTKPFCLHAKQETVIAKKQTGKFVTYALAAANIVLLNLVCTDQITARPFALVQSLFSLYAIASRRFFMPREVLSAGTLRIP